MRHNKKNNHLGRKTAHRSAMLSNMATSLIMHKRIFTTVPKAKELRKFVEPLITRSKEDTTNSRRVVFSALQNKYAVTELFQNISQKVADRPGGYTRIIKTGFRLGDNAAMCFIELVDFNENMLTDGGAKKAKTRRSRRKSSAPAKETAASTTPKAEESKEKKAEKAKEVEVKEETAKAEETPEVSKKEAAAKQEVKEDVKAEKVKAKADENIKESPAEMDKKVPLPRDNA